jgi:hypothetical protein
VLLPFRSIVGVCNGPPFFDTIEARPWFVGLDGGRHGKSTRATGNNHRHHNDAGAFGSVRCRNIDAAEVGAVRQMLVWMVNGVDLNCPKQVRASTRRHLPKLMTRKESVGSPEAEMRSWGCRRTGRNRQTDLTASVPSKLRIVAAGATRDRPLVGRRRPVCPVRRCERRPKGSSHSYFACCSADAMEAGKGRRMRSSSRSNVSGMFCASMRRRIVGGWMWNSGEREEWMLRTKERQ